MLILAYTALGALSRSDRPAAEVSRPFDGERDGFVLGEGAGVLVLEELEHAKKRGATIYAEVLGLGSQLRRLRRHQARPGSARRRPRHHASRCARPRIDPSDVDYINAHGTSTRLNDLMETVAVKRVFGDRREGDADVVDQVDGRPPDRRRRRGRGGGDGADAAHGVRAADDQPDARPTRTATSTTCPTRPARCRSQVAVSTSFGFGGQNAALVMRRFAG